jgi:hypothetical protein
MPVCLGSFAASDALNEMLTLHGQGFIGRELYSLSYGALNDELPAH